MKVSFIIPLYNRLDLTQPCLASLQATIPRGLDHEILLVDDGSTDGTREWIQTLGTPFRVLLNDRNRGYAATNNRGAAVATGNILALLNSDLVLTPHWLEPMLAVLRHHRRTGIVGNVQFRAATGELDHIGFDIGLTGKPHHDESLHWLWAPWRSRRVPAVTAACLIIPRDLFLRLRGFDEGFLNGGEDVDLCFRARALGHTCRIALHSRILHHVSASPGRKLRDEENSRRLAHRWREELIRLSGQRFNRHYGLPWSLDYFRRHCDDTRGFDRLQVLDTLLFLLGLHAYPQPWLAQHHIEDFQQEIDHWDRTLGPLPPMEFVSSLPQLASAD